MTEPMKIRATVKDGQVDVRVLMIHEMESGQRKDASGQLVPAWFIQSVTATHKGRTVLSAQWGTAVSKNPYIAFKFNGAAVGDKIEIRWTDNRGQSRNDEAVIQ